ncbi:alpha/beta hydrolase [Peredibacter starrii]|uniref:Alpha/beta fold hydrolase n=1 Tax=Peredibacter starrii TaxID=28202 RepID=A0AAX4HN31_9BACT|nr:alpha/beta fold hydrolase [Peredibacter starrii]WPU64299.1 alpha/beta fold hydrolase [Peredibacter starrii]
MRTMKRHQLLIQNQNIHFLECGEGERVVLFHCSGSQSGQWSNFMREQNQFHCIAPDLAWYGENALGPNPKTANEIDHKIVETFIDRFAPCHLIGHSYGAALLLEALQKNRNSILSATFIEPVSFHLLRDHDSSFREIDLLVQMLLEYLNDGQRVLASKKFINYWSFPYAWEFLDHRLREYMIQRIDKITYEFLPMYHKSGELLFDNVTYPVFLMEGQWTKRPIKNIMKRLSDYFMVGTQIIPMAGHLAPIGRYKTVDRMLMQNLSQFNAGNSFDIGQLNLR